MPPARKKSLAVIIDALPSDLRDLVIERASIIAESGTEWEEAERLAYSQETGRALPGIARASTSDRAATEKEVAPPKSKSVRSRR